MSNQFQISMVQVTLWRNIIFDAFLPFYLIDFILFLFLNNSDPFLVRWLPQRTLVPSFFFFYLSLLFPIFPFTFNFMWSIKLRASAGICGVCLGVFGCARVCAGVLRVCVWMCAQEWAGMPGCTWMCAWVCAGIWRCTRVYLGVPGCTLVSGCLWICMGVCMCVGWIFRISSGD